MSMEHEGYNNTILYCYKNNSDHATGDATSGDNKSKRNTYTVRIQQSQAVMIKLLLRRTYERSHTRDTILLTLVVYIKIE